MEEEKESKENKKPGDLEEYQQKCEEYLNGWKRAAADLINYKKEESAHLADIAKYTRHNYIHSLLPLMDNLELAQKKLPPELRENDHVKGLLMVKTQLEDFLRNNGATAIESIGQPFDPALHEVVAAVECGDKESGTIIEETQKGYLIDGNLLRPAKVKVVK